MKNILIEEINRFRFLSNYDNSKTSVENQVNLIEGIPGEALLKALESDRAFESMFKDEISSMKNIGLQSKDLKLLKTPEEIIDAIRGQKLSVTELGRLNGELLRTTKDRNLAEILAKDITSNKSFTKNYIGNRSKSEFIEFMKSKNLGKDKAELLWKSYQSNLKELENAKNLENAKGFKNADETLNVADEAKAKENLNKASKLDKEEEELINKISIEQQESRIREKKKELDELMNQKPNVVLDWFRRNKLIKWTKRVVPWKLLLILGSIGGVGYFAWYKWFKDKGLDVECPEGFVKDEKTGNCKGKGGGDNVIDPNDPDIINETDPSKFIECDGIYKLGCKGDDISKVQDCLGIETTGLFGKRTEDALYKRINKRTFTKDDIKSICTFQMPNITSL